MGATQVGATAALEALTMEAVTLVVGILEAVTLEDIQEGVIPEDPQDPQEALIDIIRGVIVVVCDVVDDPLLCAIFIWTSPLIM